MKNVNTIKAYIFIIIIIFAVSSVYSQHKIIESYDFPLLPRNTGQTDDLFSVLKSNFNITLRDNVILDCTKYFPSIRDTLSLNGYPGVIMCHGFGDSKTTLDSIALKQSAFGYCVYTFSMRGQGNSGGLSNLISSTEALDLMEVVNYVKHDTTTGIDSSNILIMGGSQGGIIPYMAACIGMKVKAIVSALTSPQFENSWIENGSIKSTFLFSVNYPSSFVRYDAVVSRLAGWVLADTKEKWDSLVFWLPVGRDFTNNVTFNHVPILLENSWQDKFFNTSGTINSIPFLTSPKRYYFGAVVGHGGDSSSTENQWHINFFNEWFNFWLFGINNGILTRPKFHFAYTSFPVVPYGNMWSFVHDSSAVWPPSNMSNMRLFFNTNGKLTLAPNFNNNAFVNLNNTVSGGLNMQQAVNLGFTGSTFNSMFTKSALIFDSDTLSQNLKMIGIPKINLDYSSNANICQYNFQLYEVSPTITKFISRINFTDRNYSANSRIINSFNGQAHAHIFQKGSKIRLVVTNLDTAPDDTVLLGTYPHVLPVLVNEVNNLFLSSNSYIDIPVQGGSIFVSNNQTLIPNDIVLRQNYPNPFNPSTTIEFSIPGNSFVNLKVYDLKGSEIANLISEQKEAGNYSLKFDADFYHLSSGIYFYRLSAGNKVLSKKFVLIK